MKKVLAFITAVALLIGGIFGYNAYLDGQFARLSDTVRSNRTNEPEGCRAAVAGQLNEQTVLVMGSSELFDVSDLKVTAFPTTYFNHNNFGTKALLFGSGHKQSLFHAISAAALSDDLKIQKLVLIISPQWFTPGGIPAQAFASRFSEELYRCAIRNGKLSESTKAQIASRVETLLSNAGVQCEGVEKDNAIYVEHRTSPVGFADAEITNAFAQLKEKHRTYSVLKDYSFTYPAFSFESPAVTPDWQALLKESEQNGQASCTNNEYGVNDSYYDTYMAEEIESLVGSMANNTFSVSQEFDDLKLFLTVCKELGIDPLLVSVPVNGRWYDYAGFPEEERSTYYQMIRDIADEYEVQLADYSDHEYDLYFLRDIMHLGWKGWAYIDQSIYEYSQKNS